MSHEYTDLDRLLHCIKKSRQCSIILAVNKVVVQTGHSYYLSFFFFSSRRRHTRLTCDWSSDVCSSDLTVPTSNASADLIMAVGCTNGTLSVSQTAAFQAANGGGKWALVGYVTNNPGTLQDRKNTRLNSSHMSTSYAVFCLKKRTTLNDA